MSVEYVTVIATFANAAAGAGGVGSYSFSSACAYIGFDNSTYRTHSRFCTAIRDAIPSNRTLSPSAFDCEIHHNQSPTGIVGERHLPFTSSL